jgi:hypothetical protein
MASEFLPLQELIGRVHASIVEAGERIDSGEGAVRFVIGDLTISLSVELQTEGDQVIARPPSFLEGERIGSEQLSRVTFTLRPSVPFEGR